MLFIWEEILINDGFCVALILPGAREGGGDLFQTIVSLQYYRAVLVLLFSPICLSLTDKIKIIFRFLGVCIQIKCFLPD